jgi:hypothetical protein
MWAGNFDENERNESGIESIHGTKYSKQVAIFLFLQNFLIFLEGYLLWNHI